MNTASVRFERSHFALALLAAILLEAALIAAVMLVPFPERETPPPQHPARLRVHFAPVAPPAPPKPVPPPPAPAPPVVQPLPPPPVPPRIARAAPAPHHTVPRHVAPPRPQHRARPRAAPAAPTAETANPAPRTAPAPPAPAPAEDFAAEETLAYAQALAAQVKASVQDPPAVRRGEESGIAHVRITVAPDGRLIAVALPGSSGHADIDAAVLEGVRAIHPRPFTPHMKPQTESFTLRIEEDDN